MIKIGIAGAGKFGENHIRILSKSRKCECIGFYDQDKRRSDEVSQKYNIKNFPTYDELLDSVEAVVIVVPTTFHYDFGRKALKKGVHIFVEKPITSKLEQAEDLVCIAKENGLKLQVGHIERFNPVIMQVEKKIKDPRFIECHRIAPFTPRASDVPVVLDMMIHDIDLILSFIESDVKQIQASGTKIVTKSIDIANARLEFVNGAVANVTASRISLKSSRKLRIFQKNGYFSLDFGKKAGKYITKSRHLYKALPKIMKGDFENIDLKDMVNISEISVEKEQKDALTLELESFLDSIKKNTKPIVDGKDGTRALKIAFRIIEKIN